MQYKVPIDGKWEVFTTEDLRAWKNGRNDERERAKYYEEEARLYAINPLSRFLPHGMPYRRYDTVLADGHVKIPKSCYKPYLSNDGLALMNDRENKYIVSLGPRKTGKTTLVAARMAMHLCQCEPDWPIFKKNRVQYIPWNGPTTAIIATYSYQNFRDLWEVYRHVLPVEELGEYAPGGKTMSFVSGRAKTIELKKSKSLMHWLCYSQPQAAWESFKAQLLHADEQIFENLLMAWEDGASQWEYTPAFFSLSGYVLEDRPDTGAAGFVKREIWDAADAKGYSEGKRKRDKIGRYCLDIPSTPDAILPKSKKKERFDRYVNPNVPRSEKETRRGYAVYYCGWEPGGGLAFGPDVWDKNVHLIEPLWPDDKIPASLTKYRVIDYADQQTTCCAWFAVGNVMISSGSYQFAFLYRLLYEQNMLIATLTRKIIEMSHNEQLEVGKRHDYETGNIYTEYDEKQTGEQYYRDLIDSRIGGHRHQGELVIDIFRRYGLKYLTGAEASTNQEQIPVLKEWLRIDKTVLNPFTGQLGCPRLFFFNRTEIMPAVQELDNMPAAEPNASGYDPIIDMSKPHDFIDTAKYWAACRPGSFSEERDIGREVKKKSMGHRTGSPYTKW